MTEYGRGQGSEPWHPEDPLYGDGGWGGQQAHPDPQSPYGGGRPQDYPQQPQQPQAQYETWGDGGQQYDPYGQQHPGQHQGAPQPGQQHSGQGYDPYGQQGYDQGGQYGQQPPGQQQYDPSQYDPRYGSPAQDQHGHDGGWDGGGHPGGHPPAAHPQAPGPHPGAAYPGDPSDPYGQRGAGYGAERPDQYGTQEAYPPPEPPGRRRAEPAPERRDEWEDGPEGEEHAFFADGDPDDRDGDRDRRRASGDGDHDGDDGPRGDGPRGGGRGERRGRGARPRKRRNGTACLVVCLVLGGGAAGVAYFGFQFYQDRFAAAPDFAGEGSGEQVMVTIPKGAGGSVIGQELKRAGVVKSVDAFVAAQQSDPRGKSIQDGVYTLQKEMSAKSAVELLLSPRSRSNLIIAEGRRNVAVYKDIDKRLGVSEGTTAAVAKKEWKNLGLPDWAQNHKDVKDPLEGFLFPSSYSAAKGQKPEDVLKQMVARSTEKYEQLGLAEKADDLGLDGPWQLLTVASLVQAEGKTHDDFRKMSEVVYNRLKPTNTETNQKLQFDSSFNYLMGQSKIHISESEINTNPDPYNTYYHRGLPPGPIGNPGDEAFQAALDPTADGWIYFVATDGLNKTEFAKTHSEFLKLKDKFDASSGN
ncbi:endolytic transglycosylase MltG [Streptomyces sp. SID8352]|uniref:endolytic transglycosylase MltG n=1 Tax=Streptomyces sp. SID8352 TaxID=2690338 RepID=UPI00136DBD8C|nr:endolytic transglycosylase MltG [Streptomyces sp. SID8352]MYU24601.1 endolytic transglycosylase MltG [Streptomyces sp. SID8352]